MPPECPVTCMSCPARLTVRSDVHQDRCRQELLAAAGGCSPECGNRGVAAVPARERLSPGSTTAAGAAFLVRDAVGSRRRPTLGACSTLQAPVTCSDHSTRVF